MYCRKPYIYIESVIWIWVIDGDTCDRDVLSLQLCDAILRRNRLHDVVNDGLGRFFPILLTERVVHFVFIELGQEL